jgi:hypothetical protein
LLKPSIDLVFFSLGVGVKAFDQDAEAYRVTNGYR